MRALMRLSEPGVAIGEPVPHVRPREIRDDFFSVLGVAGVRQHVMSPGVRFADQRLEAGEGITTAKHLPTPPCRHQAPRMRPAFW